MLVPALKNLTSITIKQFRGKSHQKEDNKIRCSNDQCTPPTFLPEVRGVIMRDNALKSNRPSSPESAVRQVNIRLIWKGMEERHEKGRKKGTQGYQS